MTRLAVADQQLLQGVAGTLEWVNVDGDGEPVAASGAVHVTATSTDGTTVLSAVTATADATTTGRYTYPLTAAQAADLDLLTVVWTDVGDSSTRTTYVEIVGGFLFTLQEARDFAAELANLETADLIRKRNQVTNEVEWLCDRSFRPRLRQITVDGSGGTTLVVPDNDLRAVSSVTVDGVAYTAAEVDALLVYEDRRIDQPFTTAIWSWGQLNTEIIYTYGLDRAEDQLAEAVLTRLRKLANRSKSGIPDRATQMSVDQMGTFRLAQASRYTTGYPDIDAVYSRFSKRTDGDGPGAAIARLELDPQAGSMFHWFRR